MSFLRRWHLPNPYIRRLGQCTRNPLTACFIFALLAGESIKGIALRSSTALKYITNIQKKFKAVRLVDPFYDPGIARRAEQVQQLLDIQAQWERMPNRRDPYTVCMHRELLMSNRDHDVHFLSFEDAFADWATFHLQAGCHLGK